MKFSVIDKKLKEKQSADFSNIDKELQEKLLNLWNRYQRMIIMLVLAAAVIIVGFQGVKIYRKHHITKLQSQYLEAKKAGKELDFAQENPVEPLSGVIWLEAGDKAYEKGDYSEAIAHYENAVKALRTTPLKGRGFMGIAMAHIMEGHEETGKNLLADLVHDKQIMGVFRGQVAYQLALLALQAKDYKESIELLEMIKHIPNNGIWEQKAMILIESTPGLNLIQG